MSFFDFKQMLYIAENKRKWCMNLQLKTKQFDLRTLLTYHIY